MSDDTDLAQFLEQIHEEVLARAQEQGDRSDDALREAFTSILVDDLAEYGAAGSPQVCPVNERAGRGNAIADAIDVDPDEGRVDLFVSIYRQNQVAETLTATDIKNTCKRARNLFDHIGRGWQPEAGLSSDGEILFDQIRTCFPTITELRIFVLTDCIAKDMQDTIEQDGSLKIRIQVCDIRRLHRIRNEGIEYESVEIDVRSICPDGIPCLTNPAGGEYEIHLALMPASFLQQVYDRYGPRLLELNVRSFLQLRGAVNKGIRDTLINEPSRFLAYNNGITATAEDITIELASDGSRRITAIRGFQVVNGGQTMATIHATHRNDGVDLSHVQVQAKIACLRDPALRLELVPQISRYANTQNKVNAADLSANDPVHIRIEQLSQTVWAPPGEKTRWFYERARGQYQVARSKVARQQAQKRRFDMETPVSQRLSKTDLAKYLNCWHQAPHVVSTGAQKNFTTLMRTLSGSREDIDESWYRDLIATAILYKAAEKIAHDLRLPAYRANAVAYTIALLSYRSHGRINLKRIWEQQAVSPALAETLRTWMPAIHTELRVSAGNRNVTEWCKREDCWRHVQTMQLDLPTGFEAELAASQPLPTVGSRQGRSGEGLTGEDRANIARVMMVPAERWLQIHSTGTRTGTLNPIMAGIALTLLGYASGDWDTVPSAKQAKQGVRIIQMMNGVPRDSDS